MAHPDVVHANGPETKPGRFGRRQAPQFPPVRLAPKSMINWASAPGGIMVPLLQQYTDEYPDEYSPPSTALIVLPWSLGNVQRTAYTPQVSIMIIATAAKTS